MLGHAPQVGIPSRLVAHLPATAAYVTERQQRLPGTVQGDLRRQTAALLETSARNLSALILLRPEERRHLRPGALCCVSPVADPPPATDARVPLLIRGEVGGEVDCVLPALGGGAHSSRAACRAWKKDVQERCRHLKKGLRVVSYPSLAGFSTALIHVPVPLPIPAAGRQLKAVERLRIHPGHVAPRPAVGGQQCVSEAVDRVPPLKKIIENTHTALEH